MLLYLVGTLIEVGLHGLDELIKRTTVTRFHLEIKCALYEVDFRAKKEPLGEKISDINFNQKLLMGLALM